MKVGIAITTRNRREIFYDSYNTWLKLCEHNGYELFVVDDASSVPCTVSDYRFETQAGIAKAKNKCIELMYDAGCTHMFLSDDDIKPLYFNSLRGYLSSKFNHMCLSFEKNIRGMRLSHEVFVTGRNKDYMTYNTPNGVLLYVTRECIDTIGGYDSNYGIWACEHRDFSIRIHNAGLTPHPFIDIPNSIKYFYVHDYYGNIESSVPESVRVAHVAQNYAYYEQNKYRKDYIDFRI